MNRAIVFSLLLFILAGGEKVLREGVLDTDSNEAVKSVTCAANRITILTSKSLDLRKGSFVVGSAKRESCSKNGKPFSYVIKSIISKKGSASIEATFELAAESLVYRTAYTHEVCAKITSSATKIVEAMKTQKTSLDKQITEAKEATDKAKNEKKVFNAANVIGAIDKAATKAKLALDSASSLLVQHHEILKKRQPLTATRNACLLAKFSALQTQLLAAASAVQAARRTVDNAKTENKQTNEKQTENKQTKSTFMLLDKVKTDKAKPAEKQTQKQTNKCVENPTVSTPNSHSVNYFPNPLKTGKAYFSLDHNKQSFKKVCCDGPVITLFYADTAKFEKLDKKLEKVKYLTGSEGWGCNGTHIGHAVRHKSDDEYLFEFEVVRQLGPEDLTRKFKATETCDALWPEFSKHVASVESMLADVVRIYKTIDENKKRIEKHGTKENQKVSKTVFAETKRLKTSSESYRMKFTNLNRKSCSNGFVRVVLQGKSLLTDKDLSQMKTIDDEVKKIVSGLKTQRETMLAAASKIEVSSSNIVSLLKEIKTNIKQTLKVKLQNNNGKQKQNFTLFEQSKKEILVEFDSLLATATKNKNKQTKQYHEKAIVIEKNATTVAKEVVRVDLLITEQKQTNKQNEEKEKRDSAERKTDLNAQRNEIHQKYKNVKSKKQKLDKRANYFVSTTLGQTNKDEKLKQCLGSLQKVVDEFENFSSSAKKLDKKINKQTDVDAMDEISRDISTSERNFAEQYSNCEKTVLLYENFPKTNDEIRKTKRAAEKTNKQTNKVDKQLAEQVKVELTNAQTMFSAALSLFDDREIEKAVEKQTNAKQLFEKANQKSEQTNKNIDLKSFDETNTDAENGKHRVKLLKEETFSILNKLTKEKYDVLKVYNKQAAKALKKQIDSLEKQTNDCLSGFVSLFLNDERAKKAIVCAKKCFSDAKTFSEQTNKTFLENMKTVSATLQNKTLLLEKSFVEKVVCNGRKITVTFNKDLFVDSQQLSILSTNDDTLGCVDSNTNKKTKFSRKVSKVLKTKPNKIEIETDFTTTTTTTTTETSTDISKQNKQNKLSVVAQQTNKNNFVSGTVFVAPNSPQNAKKVVVCVVVVENNVEKTIATTTTTLKTPSTKFAIGIPKETSANNANIVLKTNKQTNEKTNKETNIVGGTTTPFGINAKIKFVFPDKQTNLFSESSLLVSFEIAKESRGNDNFVVLTENKQTNKQTKFALSKNQQQFSIKVKKMPESIVSGDYFVSLLVNGVEVRNQNIITIVREKNSFQKVEFISPKNGESYKKGDIIPIRWNVTNIRNNAKLSLFVDVENRFLHLEKLIVANLDANLGKFDFKFKFDTKDTRFYIIAKHSCNSFGFDCAEDESELFSVGKTLCFNYTSIKTVSNGDNAYTITVKMQRNKECTLTKNDRVDVDLVRTGNHKKFAPSFSFNGDQETYIETLSIKEGKAHLLRFLAKHKNCKDGEPSFEFSAPYDDEFNLDAQMFNYNFGCSLCPGAVPWALATKELKESKWAKVGNVFCTVFCAVASRKFSEMRLALKNFQPETNNQTVGSRALSAAKQVEASAHNVYAKAEYALELSKNLTGCEPSLQITCQSCQLSGRVKLFNLDTFGLNVQSGNVEIDAVFDLNIRAEFSLGCEFELAQRNSTVQNDAEKTNVVIDKQSKLGKLLETGFRMEPLDIPLWGKSASLGAFYRKGSSGGDEIAAPVSVGLLLFMRFELKLTGKIAALISSKGSFSVVGVIQSDKNFALSMPTKNIGKPKISLAEAQLGAELSVSVGADIHAKVADIVGFGFNVTFAKFSLAAEFHYPRFEADSTREGNCAVPHYFEFTGTLDFFILNIEYYVLGISGEHTLQPGELKFEAFKACGGV